MASGVKTWGREIAWKLSRRWKDIIKIDLKTLIWVITGYIWLRAEIRNVAMKVRLLLSVIFWLNDEIIVSQQAFSKVYILEEMELTDAVFSFVQVKYETHVQSSVANFCSGRLHNDWEL
jgi:hypothetical protein